MSKSPPEDDDSAAIVRAIEQRLAAASGRDRSLWPPGQWDTEHDGECWAIAYRDLQFVKLTIVAMAATVLAMFPTSTFHPS